MERPARLMGCSYIYNYNFLNTIIQSLAVLLDFVFDLECSQPLVVQHFADLAAVKLEVRVSECRERYARDENEKVRVVTLALGLKRIVTELVAVGFVVDVVFFLEAVAMGVGRENVLVATVTGGRLTGGGRGRCGGDKCCPARSGRCGLP